MTEEMAQLVCSRYKNKDMDLVSKDPCKNLHMVACACNPSTRRQGQEDPLGLLAS